MPADAKKIRLDYGQLDPFTAASSLGIGGTAQVFKEDAVISFADDEGLSYEYPIKVGILEYHESLEEAPSLLGRDILALWKMTYAPKLEVLEFDPNPSA